MVKAMLGELGEDSVADVTLFCPWRAELGSLLGDIVIHTVTVLAACLDFKLLTPLIKILTEPKSMEV